MTEMKRWISNKMIINKTPLKNLAVFKLDCAQKAGDARKIGGA